MKNQNTTITKYITIPLVLVATLAIEYLFNGGHFNSKDLIISLSGALITYYIVSTLGRAVTANK